MGALDGLENQLDEIFVKKAPVQLPTDVKNWIADYIPYINLFLGLLSLWAAYVLYHWATVANRLLDYANDLARVYGTSSYTPTSRLTPMIWVSLALLAAQGAIYVISFPSVKAKSKSGWNMLFIALLLGVAYGIVSLFNGYSGASNFVSYLIGTVVGLYFLFQIRSAFLPGAKKAAPVAPVAPKDDKK